MSKSTKKSPSSSISNNLGGKKLKSSPTSMKSSNPSKKIKSKQSASAAASSSRVTEFDTVITDDGDVAENNANDNYQPGGISLLGDKMVPKKHDSINLSLLARRCIKNHQKLNPQEMMKSLNEVTHVRLDRENIQNIDGLELLGDQVKNLYLQHNDIRVIEGLETLTQLRFLTLSNNKITRLENLRNTKLGFLDLSHNEIDELDVEELPESLVILSLEGNACQLMDNYHEDVVKHCTKLSQLDGQELSIDERREAGQELSSESEGSEDGEEEGAQSTYNYHQPFDAQVVGVFDDISSDMFLRCQTRIQHIFDEHKSRITNLDRIKAEGGIYAEDGHASSSISRISAAYDSPDTTDSSRPDTGTSGLLEKERNDDLGFRLAHMKTTNASILADTMIGLSSEMTTSTRGDDVTTDNKPLHTDDRLSTHLRAGARNITSRLTDTDQ